MLCCRITGFLIDDGSPKGDLRKGIGIIDHATVTVIVTFGNQKFFCESGEVMAVGDKRVAVFAQSFGFEVLDCEEVDTISLTIALVNSRGPASVHDSGGGGIGRREVTCETTMSMSEFRHRQEEKIETVVPVEFNMGGWRGSTADHNCKFITGELGLNLVYTNDIDEPSMSGVCGLCLCPPMTLSTTS